MASVPDSPVRLYLRVTLKIATLAALAFAAVVLLQYMGYGGAGGSRHPGAIEQVNVATIDANEARRAGWRGGTVWILHRGDAIRSALADDGAAASVTRWFVVRDHGTRTGCPLLWYSGAGEFRETCSDARYDAAGRPLGDTGGGNLRSPPFTADESAGVVIIGN